jgi:hypothetical protein
MVPDSFAPTVDPDADSVPPPVQETVQPEIAKLL